MFLLLLACSDYDIVPHEPEVEPSEHHEYFWVEPNLAADVLFVVDVSGSMGPELDLLRTWLPLMIRDRGEVDLSVALTSTHAFFPTTNWDRDGVVPEWAIAAGEGRHAGISAALDDLEVRGWRANAERHLVFYSDDDDQSSGSDRERLAERVELQGITVHGVLNSTEECRSASGPGEGYRELVEATGGRLLDICDGVGALDQIGSLSEGRRHRFRLGFPANPQSIRVRISHVFATERSTEHLDVCAGCEAEFDRRSNTVVLAEGAAPREEVRIDYLGR